MASSKYYIVGAGGGGGSGRSLGFGFEALACEGLFPQKLWGLGLGVYNRVSGLGFRVAQGWEFGLLAGATCPTKGFMGVSCIGGLSVV